MYIHALLLLHNVLFFYNLLLYGLSRLLIICGCDFPITWLYMLKSHYFILLNSFHHCHKYVYKSLPYSDLISGALKVEFQAIVKHHQAHVVIDKSFVFSRKS